MSMAAAQHHPQQAAQRGRQSPRTGGDVEHHGQQRRGEMPLPQEGGGEMPLPQEGGGEMPPPSASGDDPKSPKFLIN